jgi:hypothetical protein
MPTLLWPDDGTPISLSIILLSGVDARRVDTHTTRILLFAWQKCPAMLLMSGERSVTRRKEDRQYAAISVSTP